MRAITATLLLALTSCTYHGALNEDFYTDSIECETKIPATVIISNDSSNITETLGTNGGLGGRYQVDFKTGFLDAVNDSLTDIFETVSAVEQEKTESTDFTVISSLEIEQLVKDNWNGLHVFQVSVGLEIVGNDGARKYIDNQNVTIGPTPETNFLNILTGASFFLLSPITVPATVQVAGDNGVDLIEKSITRSLNKIATDIERDRQYFITPS
jgi:hypothetical protein